MKRCLRRQLYLLRKLRRNLVSTFALHFLRAIAFLPAHAPLDVREYKSADKPSEELFIFLPGIGDVLEDYETNGFIEAVLQSGAPADMIVVDAHFGYYLRQIVIERLRADVIAPARVTGGYKEIWLAGISLGGFGALLYASVFLVEGIGLWRGKKWAEYLTIGVTASLLPLEVVAVVHRVTLVRVATLVINTAVIAYLVWELRARLAAERHVSVGPSEST